MAIRRRFGSVPPVMMMSSRSTRTRSYDAMPSRSNHFLLGYPTTKADLMARDRRAEAFMDDRVKSASVFSSYAMEEGYDTARKSRNRDAQLLRDATDAIVSSESYGTPQASVVARRVARAYSVPPRATSLPPRPYYPDQVGFWDAPRSYESLYGVNTTGTTTTADYYPYLAYPRRPLVVYSKPWFPRSPVFQRARSVPPPVYFQETPRQPVPIYDAWRSTARARSVLPEYSSVDRPLYYPYYESRPSPFYRRKLALAPPSQVVSSPWLLPTEGLRATRAPRRYHTRGEIDRGFTSFRGYYDDLSPKRRQREEDEIEDLKFGVRRRVLGSPLARATLARAFAFAPPRMAYANESKYGFPLLYVPRKGRKAAIIASKLDVDSYKGRRPRSDYAARKYRSMRRSDQEGIYTRSPRTSAIYASHPPLPKLTDRKAIRTEEGYSKPKNLLSWQYRLESIMKPKDLLYQPSSFGRIRRQVQAAQEGMDRHRQMLDRYLPEEGADSSDAAARVLRKMAELERRDPM
ncbi:hypothetical protein ACOMHN_032243 [Nucella lapillus]